MNEATIGLITGLSAALIALGAAVWTTAKTGRRQEHLQRAQWEHDRRRDAYLAFSEAGRAFVPFTEELFLLQARAEIASATSPIEEVPTADPNISLGFQFTWHDALQPRVDTEPADAWKKSAPLLLQELTAAYDGVNLEGPDDIAEIAHSVVVMAHRLTAGMPLFEMQAKAQEEVAEDGQTAGPSAWALLTTEVREYFEGLQSFRRKAKERLEEAGSPRNATDAA